MPNIEETIRKQAWTGVGLDILPDEAAYEEIIGLNELIRTHTLYSFDPTNNPPHINLYDFDFPLESIEKIASSLEAISHKHQPLTLAVTGVHYFPHGSIYLGFAPTESLLDLETEVVETLNPIREGCRTDVYWQPWRKQTEAQAVNLEKYGNPHVLDTFVPHLTIGFIKDRPEVLESICDNLTTQLHLKTISFNHLDLIAKDYQKVVLKKSFELVGDEHSRAKS